MGLWNSFVDLIEQLLQTFGDWTGNGGLAIIVLTIVVKTVLLPLTIKSVRSTAAMQEIQPKIKELQKKHGKDRQRVSQETMKLYAEHGINPAAGCLPLILQMPIFFALFFAIQNLSKSGTWPFTEGFLWISDLAKPDHVDLFFFPIAIAPMAILAGIFQFVQMRMMRPANQGKISDPQQAIMQSMMNFMPLLVVVFGWNFASGVVIYWAAQSLYSVVQQWFITGWGAMKDWFPWLPELPEHRRLGRRKPVQVKTGDDGQVQQSGVMGWMQRYAAQQEEKRAETTAAPATTSQKAATRKKVAPTAEDGRDEGHEPDIVVSDDVITVSAHGGQATRRGRRRRSAKTAEQ